MPRSTWRRLPMTTAAAGSRSRVPAPAGPRRRRRRARGRLPAAGPPAARGPGPSLRRTHRSRTDGGRAGRPVSRWRARRNTIAPTHTASSTHSQPECAAQKNGRRSSSTSRSVPPPNAASPVTRQTPTASRRLRAASSRPDSAKASVALPSTTVCSSERSGRSVIAGLSGGTAGVRRPTTRDRPLAAPSYRRVCATAGSRPSRSRGARCTSG